MDNNKNKDLENKAPAPAPKQPLDPEVGGYKGQNPTEHGDWQHKGRTTDF
ncbi:MAG: DUF1674 domain-containing protein [Alphaproteobacteria bacterium]|nr:MAG: DUF1674 domain-containing protein [Alphaproteobacteria bacterium]